MVTYGDPHREKRKKGKETGTRIGTRRKGEVCRSSRHRGSPSGHREGMILTQVYVHHDTQTRLTGGGGAEHDNLNVPRFVLLRENVDSHLELLRLERIKQEVIEYPVKGLFVP